MVAWGLRPPERYSNQNARERGRFDQASRATIEFAGNAQALVEGGAHIVDVQMYIEADFNLPGVTVNLVSVDGEITSTGVTDDGDTFTPTWAWTPDGNKVIATMVGRGVSIADTRPAVVVSVQETATSDPVEFVLTAEAGSGRARERARAANEEVIRV